MVENREIIKKKIVNIFYAGNANLCKTETTAVTSGMYNTVLGAPLSPLEWLKRDNHASHKSFVILSIAAVGIHSWVV